MASIHARTRHRTFQSKQTKSRRGAAMQHQIWRRQRVHARQTRRRIQAIEAHAPSVLQHLTRSWRSAFSWPTYFRVVILLLAAFLTLGNHTILNALRTVAALNVGHTSSYHPAFSRSPWSIWRLGYCVTLWVIEHFAPDGPIFLVGDETADVHRGKKVFGKGRHRDAMRSSHYYNSFLYENKYVILMPRGCSVAGQDFVN